MHVSLQPIFVKSTNHVNILEYGIGGIEWSHIIVGTVAAAFRRATHKRNTNEIINQSASMHRSAFCIPEISCPSGSNPGSFPHLTCKHKFLKGIKEDEKDFC